MGSIPTSIWVGKVFYGIDIREHGSGNPGASNTFRILGAKAGIPVFLIDVAKGWFALTLATYSGFKVGTEQFAIFQLILGLFAFLGHLFPVFANFRGGKGVATLAGVSMAIHPLATTCSIAIFTVAFLFSGYVSIGSLIAAIAFPLLVIFSFGNTTLSIATFSISVAIMLILTHRKNIKRLREGEEHRFTRFTFGVTAPEQTKPSNPAHRGQAGGKPHRHHEHRPARRT